MAGGARGIRKSWQGIVVSDKMDKTAVVQVERMVLDPRYKKYVRRRRKFMAHDEKDECRLGDRVEIVETRPVSRNKRFKVVKIIERGKILAEEVAGNDSK
jgi:small subunit ribosomal protein S17